MAVVVVVCGGGGGGWCCEKTSPSTRWRRQAAAPLVMSEACLARQSQTPLRLLSMQAFPPPPLTMSEACLATAVPEPIAIPMSARRRAGASFTPSPVIATTCPCWQQQRVNTAQAAAEKVKWRRARAKFVWPSQTLGGPVVHTAP